MNKATFMLGAILGLALAGCDGHGNHAAAAVTPPAPSPPVNPGSTDFTSFVTAQVQTQPAFGTAEPMPSSMLTTNLGLDDASVYAKVMFGTGDALPAGTYQGSVACMQAGSAACNPAISTDPNSTLN